MLVIKDFLPKLGGEKLRSTNLIWECPACSSENTLVAEVEARCIKIFNLPLVPLGKNLNVICSNCSYQSTLDDLPEDLKKVCSGIYKSSKTPLRYYYLLIIVVILVSILSYWKYVLTPDFKEYFSKPKVGDIYLMNTGADKTGYAMVTGVEQRFVNLATFKERPDSIYNIAHIDNSVQIRAVFTTYNREQLNNLYEAGIILDVERSDLPEGVKMYQMIVKDQEDEPDPGSGSASMERIPVKNKETKVKNASPANKNSR